MARQKLRLVTVRKPSSFDDQKTPSDIKNNAETASTENEQVFIEYVLSQLRQILGTNNWNDNVPDSLSNIVTSIADLLAIEYGVELLGVKDGVNATFTTPTKFKPDTIKVFFNGLRQKIGVGNDFIVTESGGVGTGYDTVILDVSLAPYANESVVAEYVKDV